MPCIFHNSEGRWRLLPVATSPSVLRLDPLRVEPAAPRATASDSFLLVRAAAPARPAQWALLVAGDADVRHNGMPVSAGLRVLEHRDALAFAGATRATGAAAGAAAEAVFFTTEELAHVETFAGTESVSCPRCRSELRHGDAAVRCPSCGVVHHEATDRNCWTYAPACALCSQPTALDAGLRWTPEEDL